MSGQDNGSKTSNGDGEISRREVVYLQPAEYAYAGDDEISLVDLWLILTRRKWTIVGITVLCLALGLAYALIKSETFEYRTGIELARVHGGPGSGGLELVFPKDESVVMLQDLLIPQARENIFGKEEGQRFKVEVNKEASDNTVLLKTEAESQDRKKVEKLHQSIADALAKRHVTELQKKIKLYISPFQSRVELLNEQIDTLEQQLKEMSEHSYSAQNENSLVIAQQMGDIREELASVRVQRSNEKSAVETIREASHPTRVSFLASESYEPVGMGNAVIVALSLVVGVILGVFAAFFRQFLANVRAASSQR
ncbi:Wzz/FepE/Etk N-terminal domain-containing protein [Desulfovermiculus halophilus]|uniref:Wzz/FepE/Etk N-terminal domain-containing protein n=1 Tax=Desulfovermiculus halophilus TaxID=339722 RepID=UPI0004815CB5|nr:Wzz/FepE/Etk N-terminal domain-containing protein [Desulfovermiculus halophilus]